jgi:MYXO-CTERM domain-containing protein
MTRRSIRRQAARVAAVGGLALMMLAGGTTVLAADQTVDISGFAFAPGDLTVTVGDTVTWANADAQGHTATADDGAFDTGTIAGNSSEAVTLTTAGTFAYHCRIHPAMTATLVVTVAAAESPPPTDTLDPVAVSPTADPTLAIGLALAGLAGLALARRRFGGLAAGR